MKGSVHKTIVFTALVSMVFYLSFSVVTPFIDCKDSCTCGCADTKTVNSSCCSSQNFVTVKKGCCDNDAHDTHLKSSTNSNLRNIQCDLRPSVFNGNIFTEISSVNIRNDLSSVNIVYYIFKPPIF